MPTTSTRRVIAIVLTVVACVAVVRDQALPAALFAAAAAFAASWSLRPASRGRTVHRPAPLPGAKAARPSGYSGAAMVAFARSAPALAVAVGDRPTGWLDGIAARDRRTLATAGVLHVDPRAGLTLTPAGYTLASRL